MVEKVIRALRVPCYCRVDGQAQCNQADFAAQADSTASSMWSNVQKRPITKLLTPGLRYIQIFTG